MGRFRPADDLSKLPDFRPEIAVAAVLIFAPKATAERGPFRVLCHEAKAVQTAARNFIGDEGRSFGFGDQVADPEPQRAALVKSQGAERCGNVGTIIPAGTVERGERKRTVDEVSKAD